MNIVSVKVTNSHDLSKELIGFEHSVEIGKSF